MNQDEHNITPENEVPPASPVHELSQTRPDAFFIDVTKDNMTAYLVVDVNAVSMKDFSPTILYNFLANSSLNQEMVNFQSIKIIADDVGRLKQEASREGKMVPAGKSIVKQEVSRGIPMIPGLDGWVKFYHPHNQRVVIREDGNADFRNLDKYISIKQQEKIATMFVGLAGTPGKDVYGTVLNPPSIKRPKITIGGNIVAENKSSPEEPDKVYVEYFASCNGVLFSTDESITVSPELRITENVGLSTGNIKYDGTVNVEGSVEDGSVIISKEALNISENLESTGVQVGTDLYVKAGIKTRNRNVIKVGGTVKAKFIENAVMEVDGDIIVEGSILNADIQCLGSVLLTGQNSAILGSKITVMKGLSTVNLGSAAGMDVVIEFGVHFKNERLFHEIQAKIRNSEKELAALIPQVQQANNLIKQSRGKMDGERKDKIKELFEVFRKLNAAHKFLLDKFEELKTSRFNTEQVTLVVKGAAYPGALIKYRRQAEKLTAMQSAFMMNFTPGQDHAPMTAINSRKIK